MLVGLPNTVKSNSPHSYVDTTQNLLTSTKINSIPFDLFKENLRDKSSFWFNEIKDHQFKFKLNCLDPHSSLSYALSPNCFLDYVILLREDFFFWVAQKVKGWAEYSVFVTELPHSSPISLYYSNLDNTTLVESTNPLLDTSYLFTNNLPNICNSPFNGGDKLFNELSSFTSSMLKTLDHTSYLASGAIHERYTTNPSDNINGIGKENVGKIHYYFMYTYYQQDEEEARIAAEHEVPNLVCYYPEPFIASPSFHFEELWFLHILHYQHWLWFTFITLIMFYLITFINVVRWCNVRAKPKRETRGVSRSKCADFITVSLPITWAIIILISASTRPMDRWDGADGKEVMIGIKAYQWGWEYFYPKALDLHYRTTPTFSEVVGNSIKYSFASEFKSNSAQAWRYYQLKNQNATTNTPAQLVLSPSDKKSVINLTNFDQAGINPVSETSSYRRLKYFSKTTPQNIFNDESEFTERFNKINSLYLHRTDLNTSYKNSTVRQHNFTSTNSLINKTKTFLERKAIKQFTDYKVGLNYDDVELQPNSKIGNNTTYNEATSNLNIVDPYHTQQLSNSTLKHLYKNPEESDLLMKYLKHKAINPTNDGLSDLSDDVLRFKFLYHAHNNHFSLFLKYNNNRTNTNSLGTGLATSESLNNLVMNNYNHQNSTKLDIKKLPRYREGSSTYVKESNYKETYRQLTTNLIHSLSVQAVENRETPIEIVKKTNKSLDKVIVNIMSLNKNYNVPNQDLTNQFNKFTHTLDTPINKYLQSQNTNTSLYLNPGFLPSSTGKFNNTSQPYQLYSNGVPKPRKIDAEVVQRMANTFNGKEQLSTLITKSLKKTLVPHPLFYKYEDNKMPNWLKVSTYNFPIYSDKDIIKSYNKSKLALNQSNVLVNTGDSPNDIDAAWRATRLKWTDDILNKKYNTYEKYVDKDSAITDSTEKYSLIYNDLINKHKNPSTTWTIDKSPIRSIYDTSKVTDFYQNNTYNTNIKLKNLIVSKNQLNLNDFKPHNVEINKVIVKQPYKLLVQNNIMNLAENLVTINTTYPSNTHTSYVNILTKIKELNSEGKLVPYSNLVDKVKDLSTEQDLGTIKPLNIKEFKMSRIRQDGLILDFSNPSTGKITTPNTENSNFTNNYKRVSNIDLRATATKLKKTSTIPQKIFTTKFDNFGSYGRADDISNYFVKHPKYLEKTPNYSRMLSKNSEKFFKMSYYNLSFNENFNKYYTTWNTLNTSFGEIPFLLSKQTDATRYAWFDWYSQWNSIRIQQPSASEYSLMGLPFSGNAFDFDRGDTKSIILADGYLTQLSHGKKNYLPNWAMSTYLLHRITKWYKTDVLFNNVFTPLWEDVALESIKNEDRIKKVTNPSYQAPKGDDLNKVINLHKPKTQYLLTKLMMKQSISFIETSDYKHSSILAIIVNQNSSFQNLLKNNKIKNPLLVVKLNWHPSINHKNLQYNLPLTIFKSVHIRMYITKVNSYKNLFTTFSLNSTNGISPSPSVFTHSNSVVNIPHLSYWKPITKAASYYHTGSVLIDILSRRESLYRKYLSNFNQSFVLPNKFIASPKNDFVQTIKSTYPFINPTTFNSEDTREFYYTNDSYIKLENYRSLVKLYIDISKIDRNEIPLNFMSNLNNVVFYLFGRMDKNQANNKAYLHNSAYKNQYRPVRKGITNMIKLHCTGAVAIPTHMKIHLVASSKDIIHSWAIPGAGMKIDCIPGFTAHRVTMFLASGIFWGQCMEICGRFHHWMPIVLYLMKKDLFFLWCTHFIHFTTVDEMFNMNDKQLINHVRVASFAKSSWVSEVLRK